MLGTRDLWDKSLSLIPGFQSHALCLGLATLLLLYVNRLAQPPNANHAITLG